MAGITFPGIGSGIDGAGIAKSVYDQLTLSNQVRKNGIDFRSRENTALEKLRSMLQDLSGSLDSARTANGGAAARKATSSDTNVASAVAGSNASLGIYNVTVSSVAAAASGSFDRSYTGGTNFIISNPADAGTVSFTVGSGAEQSTFDVNVGELTTAESFVQSFNSAADGKASASLINVGTASSPQYRISFSSAETGADKGSISVSASNASLLSGAGLGSSTISQATNAQFAVTGVSGTIERSTNSVDDVIPGITLNLKATGSTTVAIAEDGGAARSQVEAFVAAFNALANYASSQDAITPAQQDGERVNVYGSLAQTNVDDDALTELRSALASAGSSNGVSLAALGVTTNRDGTLAFDAKTFDKAYGANSAKANETVAALADRVSGVQGIAYKYTGYGLAIDQAIETNKGEVQNLTDKISSVERSAESQQKSLLSQFSRLESLFAKLNADSSYLSRLFKF